MDDQGLNLNYPLLPTKYIELESKIKQSLRDVSLNIKIEKEIQRYSDKYISTITHEDVMKSINIELMGPELIQIYGMSSNKEIDEVEAEVGENEDDENNEESSENESDKSLGGGDDYDAWYNDEEDLVDENDYRGDDDNIF